MKYLKTTGFVFGTIALILALSYFSTVKAADFTLIRGDCNQDAQVDMSDAISILSYLYSDWDSPCLAACDVHDDGFVEDADYVYLVNFLFQGGPPPAFPFPTCGEVETTLACDDDSACP